MNRTVIVALLVLIAVVGAATLRFEYRSIELAKQIRHLTEEVHALVERVTPQGADVVSTTYPSTGGNHTVATNYQAGWTKAQWKARHDQNVEEAQGGDWPLVLPQ